MKDALITAIFLVALAGLQAGAGPPAAPAAQQPPAGKEPAGKEGARKEPADQKPAEQQPACRVCGGTCQLTPVCVCEPATKKKKKTTYSMKCAPVCVPEPCLSHHGPGRRHAASCTGSGCDGSCGAATVRTKKLLLKTITEEEVDIIEHKVDYLCRHCAGIDAAPTSCSCAGRGRALAPRPWWQCLWPW